MSLRLSYSHNPDEDEHGYPWMATVENCRAEHAAQPNGCPCHGHGPTKAAARRAALACAKQQHRRKRKPQRRY